MRAAVDRLLTARQVADLLGVSVASVLRRWRAGELPGVSPQHQLPALSRVGDRRLAGGAPGTGRRLYDPLRRLGGERLADAGRAARRDLPDQELATASAGAMRPAGGGGAAGSPRARPPGAGSTRWSGPASRGDQPKPEDLTLAEFAERYLQAHAVGREESTIDTLAPPAGPRDCRPSAIAG